MFKENAGNLFLRSNSSVAGFGATQKLKEKSPFRCWGCPSIEIQYNLIRSLHS